MKRNVIKNTVTVMAALAMIITTVISVNDASSRKSQAFVGASWSEGFESIEEMASSSDVIITGEVIEHIPEEITGMIFTNSVIEIGSVVSGELDSTVSKIKVLQTGGILGEKETPVITDNPILKNGSDYLLFLRANDLGHYNIMGGIQGAYEMNEDKLKSNSKGNGLAKEMKEQGYKEIEKLIKKIKK